MTLVCPHCRGSLAERPSAAVIECTACERSYVNRHGIPDLRTLGDPYLSLDEDARAADRLAARAPNGFREMLAFYYAENVKVSAAQADRFITGMVAASGRAQASLTVWQDLSGTAIANGVRFLDLGAGTGPLAAAAARTGARVVAVDCGLRWLVIAAQRCQELGVAAQLVCANAEALPFAQGSVDVVGAESLLEHTARPESAVEETRRVLTTKGQVWLSTPNKYFLGPDPHIGRLAGGWLSQESLRRYCEARGMVPPKRTLFSARSITQLLSEGGFRNAHLSVPTITAEQRQGASALIRWGVDAYMALRHTPLLREALQWVGPTLMATAHAS